MAASMIDEPPAVAIAFGQPVQDAPIVLRRRLLAEIMPSILHELSQPLTCVMLQHAVSRRAMPIDAMIATEALVRAEDETKRAASLVESMNLLSSAQAEPITEQDLNLFVGRAATLLRRELYDRRCALEVRLAPLPLARLSPTTALEALLRAILVGSRATSSEAPRLSIVTQLTTDGDFVQVVFRRTDASGASGFATVMGCSNYPHIARAIQSDGGRIRLCNDDLIIAFPVAEASMRRDVIDA